MAKTCFDKDTFLEQVSPWVCVCWDGGGWGVTVLSMGKGMCLRATLLRIKMKPDYLPSSV